MVEGYVGYVYKTEMHMSDSAADNPPDPKSLLREAETRASFAIIYAPDGETVLGKFYFSGGRTKRLG